LFCVVLCRLLKLCGGVKESSIFDRNCFWGARVSKRLYIFGFYGAIQKLSSSSSLLFLNEATYFLKSKHALGASMIAPYLPQNSLISFSIFTADQCLKFGIDFRLWGAVWFRNKATYRNVKQTQGEPMTSLCPPKISYSLVHLTHWSPNSNFNFFSSTLPARAAVPAKMYQVGPYDELTKRVAVLRRMNFWEKTCKISTTSVDTLNIDCRGLNFAHLSPNFDMEISQKCEIWL